MPAFGCGEHAVHRGRWAVIKITPLGGGDEDDDDEIAPKVRQFFESSFDFTEASFHQGDQLGAGCSTFGPRRVPMRQLRVRGAPYRDAALGVVFAGRPGVSGEAGAAGVIWGLAADPGGIRWTGLAVVRVAAT